MTDDLVVIDGWQLRRNPELFGDDKPRVLDLEVARRLEFDRPRDIRKLLDRIATDKNVSDFGVCATVAQTPRAQGGRPTREYWLTEEQTVVVIGRSDTPIAFKIACEVARVFVAWRHGRLSSVANPQHLSAVVERIERLEQLLEQALTAPTSAAGASPDAVISAATYDALQMAIKRQAFLEVLAGDWPEKPANRRRATGIHGRRVRTPVERACAGIRNHLAEVLRWGGKGKPWRLLPAAHVSEAFAVLRAREVDVIRKLGGTRAARHALAEHDGQLGLFQDAVSGKKREPTN